MDYHTIVKTKYPKASDEDFTLRDDGSGVYIDKWDSAKLGAKPTIAELKSHWPTVKAQMQTAALREQRDKLLAESDWTQVADAPLTATQKQAWATYRQALRDAPTTGIIPTPSRKA